MLYKKHDNIACVCNVDLETQFIASLCRYVKTYRHPIWASIRFYYLAAMNRVSTKKKYCIKVSLHI